MGRLFQKVADNKSRQGTMFAIKASIEHVKETVEAFDEVGLSIAAHNGPFSVVISGDRTNCMNIVTHFWNRHIPCCEIAVPGAGHSAHVDCILHELSASLATVPARSERIPIYSTVSGTLARGQDFQGEYWSRNARQTVLFAEAVETLRKDGYKMFLELNAHPLLCGAIAECFRVHKQDVVVRPSLECGRDDSTVLGETLLALNTVGLQN
jgi:acyl transferase domain-containing protein